MVKNDFPEVPQSPVDTLRIGSQYRGSVSLIKILIVAVEKAQNAGPKKEKMKFLLHKLCRVSIIRKRRNHTMKQALFLTFLNSKNFPCFNSFLNFVPQ